MRSLPLSPVLACAVALAAAPAVATVPMGWTYWQSTPTVHSLIYGELPGDGEEDGEGIANGFHVLALDCDTAGGKAGVRLETAHELPKGAQGTLTLDIDGAAGRDIPFEVLTEMGADRYPGLLVGHGALADLGLDAIAAGRSLAVHWNGGEIVVPLAGVAGPAAEFRRACSQD